jgi:putative intracellular protease/amidase
VPAAPTYARAGASWDALFDRFWQAYPRHVAKATARKAWHRALRLGADPTDVIRGAERYAADPNREPTYTAHPTTWLNGGRWQDDPLPARTSTPVSRAEATIRAVAGGPAPPLDYTAFYGPTPIDATARGLGA